MARHEHLPIYKAVLKQRKCDGHIDEAR